MKKIICNSELINLGNHLIDEILNRSNEFETINVIIPNSKIEQWFKTYWLKNQEQVLMNVNFINIDEALVKFIKSNNSCTLINKQELKMLIFKNLSIKNNIELPEHIYSYLYINGDIDPIKMYDLSNKLAELFLEYEEDQIEINGWQKELYEIVLNDSLNYHLTTLDYLYKNKINIEENDNAIYFFGFISFNNLQEKIIEEYAKKSNVIIYMLDEEGATYKDYTVVSAASKIRELEFVHSKISELLKESSNSYSDFLVLAPNINAYENLIPRVFSQDNVDFSNIPYIINDIKRKDNDFIIGLKKFFEIHKKGFYTRLDFFELINNEDIRKARNITHDDIEAWINAILSMNVFRNSVTLDDWNYAKKRVLLSKIVNINNLGNNIVELADNQYLPYSSISLNDESIVKFVKFIDDMESFCNLLNRIEFINNENILEVKIKLEKWFSIKDFNDIETNKNLKKAMNIIYNWIHMNISNNNIRKENLFYLLFDECKDIEHKSNDYFVKGITFTNFDMDVVMQAKYIFFLNLGAKELPTKMNKSEIDIRDYDISKNRIEERTFNLQCLNASKKLYISHLNKDLKTDEDLYPSSFVINLEGKKAPQKIEISLDETRDWNDLYTKREYKNKDYFLGLLSTKENKNLENIDVSYENLKKIKVTEMAEYLEEPLKYKANYLFGKIYDNDEKIRDEYEPFKLNKLDETIISSKIILDIMKNKDEYYGDEYFEKLFNKLNLEHSLPNINKLVNNSSFDQVKSVSKNMKDSFEKKYGINYEIISINDLVFGQGENQWVLTCNKEICRSIQDTKIIYTQIKKNPSKTKESNFTFIYIASLMDVASFENENEYEVILYRKSEKTFKITPKEARELLEKIYNAMNDYSINNFSSIDFLSVKNFNFDILIGDIEKQGSPWEYYKDKKMFEYYTQLGLDTIQSSKEYRVIQNKHIELIKYLKAIPEESDGVENEQ